MLRVLIIVLSISILGCDLNLEDWSSTDAAPAAPNSADAAAPAAPQPCAEKIAQLRAAYPQGYHGSMAWYYPGDISPRTVYFLDTFPCSGGRGFIRDVDGNVLELPVNTEAWVANHCWIPREWGGATCQDDDGRLSCQVTDVLRASATVIYDPNFGTCNWFLFPNYSNIITCAIDQPCSFGGLSNSTLAEDGGVAENPIIDAGATAAASGDANSAGTGAGIVFDASVGADAVSP